MQRENDVGCLLKFNINSCCFQYYIFKFTTYATTTTVLQEGGKVPKHTFCIRHLGTFCQQINIIINFQQVHLNPRICHPLFSEFFSQSLLRFEICAFRIIAILIHQFEFTQHISLQISFRFTSDARREIPKFTYSCKLRIGLAWIFEVQE